MQLALYPHQLSRRGPIYGEILKAGHDPREGLRKGNAFYDDLSEVRERCRCLPSIVGQEEILEGGGDESGFNDRRTRARAFRRPL